MILSQIKYCCWYLRNHPLQRGRVFIVILINILVTNATAQSANEDILKVDVPAVVEPGKYFTLFADIKRNIAKDTLFEPSINVPEKWRLLLGKKTLSNDTLVRYIYTIMCPADAKASEHEVLMIFKMNKTILSKRIKVLVKRVRDIQITSFDNPDYVKEGDSLKVQFLVYNGGNADEKLFIKSTQAKIEKLGDSLLLKKKESIQITVSQKVPKTAESTWYITSDLVTLLKDSLNPIISLVSTTVYGIENKPQDQSLRFPIEIGGMYIGAFSEQSKLKALQYDVRGRGFLDFSKNHFVEFVIHGPDQFNIPITGSYEILSLKYIFKKRGALQVGDYQLKLSNLVEFGRFSRGFRYDYDFKKIGFSVFYAKPRFFSDINYEYGANVRFTPSTKFQLGVDLVKKSNQNFLKPNTMSNLVSITSSYRARNWDIETEVAMSETSNKKSYAFYNNLNLNLGKLYLSSNLIYASKDFQGFYKNSWLAINNLNYRFSNKLSVGFSHNFTRINPSLDLLVYNSSPYINSLMVVGDYQINERNQVRVSYNWQEREDRMMPQNFHYKEDFANVMYSYFSKQFSINYSGRFGSAQNLLVPNDATTLRRSIANALNPQVKIGRSIWFGAILEHQQTSKYSANNAITNYYFYGSTLKINAKHWLNASFMYRNNYTPDALVETQSFVNGMINVNIKEKHAVSVNFGKTFVPYQQNINLGTRDMFYFSVKYSLKLNLPIARNRRVGAIHGQVSSLDADIRVSDVLIKLGNKKTVTDAKGNFYFNGLIQQNIY